jgi:DNA-binding transcriptional regulator YhcF (GntR family)
VEHRRIVAEISERIGRGDLKPGDRVPSTRAITRQYGVAMATATKVIAALRDAGLVETRSGAGTVVSASGTASPILPRVTDLTRDRLLRAAVAVADKEGLAALTMRRVASDIGVATMSLYRHVSGKDEMVLLMTDAVFGDDPLPARPPDGWRERLEVAGRRMWTVFRRHPWAAEALSLTRPQALSNLMSYSEWSLGALRDLGLPAQRMMYAHLTLIGHIRTTALNLLSERRAEEDTGLTADEWVDTQPDLLDVVSSGRFPALAHVAEQGFDYDIDALFEYGLARLLDGIATDAGRT